jgi:predicted Fe-Mo cluster-binding NifX family protein
MKIGITSQNFRTITGHAGKSRRFIVLSPQADGSLQEVERLDLPKEMSMHEFHGTSHPLYDLDVLITGGAGAGFIRHLGAYGVKVVATAETDPLKAASDFVAGRPLPPPAPDDHDHRHGQPQMIMPK